jgi:hypothetical protein
MSKKAKKTTQRRIVLTNLKSHIKENKLVFAVYLLLRALVIALLVFSIISGNYENAFVCVLALALFLLPAFLEANLGIHLPTTIQIVALIFVFCAEILGEISAYYQKVPFWDTMLHTVNGFLFAAFGFALVDIFNRNPRFKFELSPAFLAFVSFCFSMTVGVLWEFFEFGCDVFMHTDMQKDYIINAIYSVDLGVPAENQVGVIKDITDVVINGQSLGLGGYLDIGLFDTMKDLLVNFVGAVVFSIIGYFYIKSDGNSRFASQFIPTLKAPELKTDNGTAEEKDNTEVKGAESLT